ncbi:expressed unknown protein [Seminavis robusta]|uniref:Uncharacterized protein n=1 Tax=Seminavis robusta TaxID=568900 RepID=A0A9N8EQX2_9STRA|nr:expressed unknown protein [Seminavis robusta]|eukprot:Sro1368_g266790.1 n/a (418) ;mRNA; r:11281-12638
MTAIRSASLLLVCLALLSLRGSDALFVQPRYRVKSYPALKLAIADRLGIPYKSVAYDAGKQASLPSFALSLDAKFGALDEASFNALQKSYCAWSETKSKVKWKEGRKYRLLDFLPPLPQAVSGLYFQSSRTKQRGLPSFVGGPDERVKRYTDQEVLLTSNCWGFAWELLFQADNADTSAMTISTADPTSAWREFTGPGFDLIQSSRTQPKLLKDGNLRNRKLKGGDVLLVWHENPSTASGEDLYLDHVATVIDDDVYFEKSGSGDRVPFRVNTWDGLVANFPPSVFFWEWRRLVRNNPLSPTAIYGSPQTRLRPATEVFGIDAQVASSSNTGSYADRFLKDRFSILSKLRPSVQQSLSLQADTGEGGVIEAQTYTGILVLEDLVFDKATGRASLPSSAFVPEWYMKALKMMSKNPYT